MHVAFIGFGEAGRAFAQGLRGEPAGQPGRCPMSAYDLLLDLPPGAPAADRARATALREAAARAQVRLAVDHADAVRDADLVFLAVTAATSLQAARSAAPGLRAGQWLLDVNSVSPGRKRETEALVAPTGAAYVDVAVMSPVHPALHRTPLLVGGPGGATLMPALGALGMRAEYVDAATGTASAVKMVRSIVVKGLEALLVEAMAAGAAYGVNARVLASLDRSHPGWDWTAMAGYAIERVASHGARRAAEMREVAATVAETGLEPLMAAATAERQQWVADLGVARRFAGAVPAQLDPLLAAIAAAREAAAR